MPDRSLRMPDVPAAPWRHRANARQELLRRLGAIALMLFSVALCHRLAFLGVAPSRATTFVTLLAVGGGAALFTHAMGAWTGAALGATVGLSASIALTTASNPPVENGLTFALLAAFVTGALGWLSGRRTLEFGEMAAGIAPGGDVCGAIASDFCAWVRGFADFDDEDTGVTTNSAPRHADSPSWSDFDQFVRQTLRQRLGASGVRGLSVSADGKTLQPLSCRRSAARKRDSGGTGFASDPTRQDAGLPNARAGLIGRVLRDGGAFVSQNPQHDGFCEELAREQLRHADSLDARSASPAADGWRWLLPLHYNGRVRAVVAVARLSEARVASASSSAELALARQVRDLLETQWAYVNETQALHSVARTDRQSGMLGRNDLLTQLRRDADQATRDNEPLMVLALGVEGLRRLDDRGDWEQRDTLIEHFALALRSKVRSDDALGRFSDDRFVVVLRRLDQALGQRIAAKLIETARDAVAAINEADDAARGGRPPIAIRGGLVGTCGGRAVGDDLLERALRLLDVARRSNLSLATEPQSESRPGIGNADRAAAPAREVSP